MRKADSLLSLTHARTVAILGRPNVGKSTLFNRLTHSQRALIDDQPGVTRDRLRAAGHLGHLHFQIIDTPGLEWPLDTPLREGMWHQSLLALKEADIALFLVDGREGILPYEEDLLRQLRRKGSPIILVANKCERAADSRLRADAARMGFPDLVAVSAAHGGGMSDLLDALSPFIDLRAQDSDDANSDDQNSDTNSESEPEHPQDLSITILGRPNAGKSTLMNRLLGEERSLTGEQPGLTRDAISEIWTDGERRIHLVDTAGIRRRTRVIDDLEKRSVRESFRALQYCHVALLVIDAGQALEKQDLLLAQKIIDEGRGLIVVINKWDTVTDPTEARSEIEYRLEKGLSVRKVPLLTLSALTGRNVDKIFECALKVYALWQQRVSTSDLNQWLARATQHHPPPQQGQRRVKIKYITQVKSRPPTFALFVNRADVLDESYLRYLRNDLAKTFGLEGIPLRIQPRASNNPYAS